MILLQHRMMNRTHELFLVMPCALMLWMKEITCVKSQGLAILTYKATCCCLVALDSSS